MPTLQVNVPRKGTGAGESGLEIVLAEFYIPMVADIVCEWYYIPP
jgi:hypothetical protein